MTPTAAALPATPNHAPPLLALAGQGAHDLAPAIAIAPTAKRISLTSSSLGLSLNPSYQRPGHAPLPIVPPPPLGQPQQPQQHPHPSRPKAKHVHAHPDDPHAVVIDDRRHPRELVPLDIGFPTPAMEGRIRKEDLDDRLLMATCAIIHSHQNRALCPKEVAEVMFERNWLHNAGTTPFAHISTCIRSHLRRAHGDASSPPYPAILLPFDLTGALSAPEVRAVGLRAEERPAVKRGTLWYLNEAVLGRDVGAGDPFIRCRREAGLAPSELDGVYQRPRHVAIAATPNPAGAIHAPTSLGQSLPPSTAYPMLDDDDDDTGMGRGKRKRRASSAMMAATEVVASPLPIPQFSATAAAQAWGTAAPPHRRAQSFGAGSGGSHSLPTKSGVVPRLRLRLTSLEEVDSSGISDSDGQTSDAQRRRRNKKKARRAASEGTSRGGSVDTLASDDEHHQPTMRALPAFSSAASSALLAQSLLAASASSPAHAPSSSQASVVSPNSLHFASGPFSHRHSYLSMSAPNLFSAFSNAPSPDTMEVDDSYDGYRGSRTPSDVKAEQSSDSAGEDDFHEAMLRGDDFDFEWGSESYESQDAQGATAGTFSSMKAKGKLREMSLGLADQATFDDMDAASTPATTPRSPPSVEEDVLPKGTSKMGMEETLCEAFAAELDRVHQVLDGTPVRLDRAESGGSLASLVKEEDGSSSDSDDLHRQDPEDGAALALPLPSPLALELSPLLPLPSAFETDYDFVGHDDDLSHYRSEDAYERDMAESADDEDEDSDADDIVTVKIEENDEHDSFGPASRQSSVFPLDSFSRRIMMSTRRSESLSDSGDSDGDSFDPHMIVSNSLLASGLPVPQVAPSPPDTTSEWGMHLDLDDLDLDLEDGIDLLGPETVGLEELDLAWGGPAEQREDESDWEWRERTAASRAEARGRVVGPTFLTGSSEDAFKVALSQRDRDERTRTLVSAASVVTAPVSPPTPSSRTEPKAVNDVIVYPKIPLTPQVTATIIQGGIAVYATPVVSSEDSTTSLLYRRIDTDYINGTVLLAVTFLSPPERDAILSTLPDTFSVSTGESGIPGQWVTLPHARTLVKRFPALSHLVTFLDDELGERFPEPIPSMRAGLRAALATSSSSVLGYPPLADSFLNPPVADKGKASTMRSAHPTPPASAAASTSGGRKRKTSVAVVTESPAPTTASVRKTRRSVATK